MRNGQSIAKSLAQVAELVDALVSGTSAFTGVEVRVLSWAPIQLWNMLLYQLLTATAGFHPWSHTVTNCCRQPVHLASSRFASHPAVDPVRADLSGCRACCVSVR